MGKISLHITSFLLAALIFVKMLGMPIIFVSFQINKEYIANQLCENRTKPQLHCNGQCVLMKKLAKANESNESKETKSDVKSIGIDFKEELPDHSISPLNNLQIPYSNQNNFDLLSPYINAIFHPPAVA